MLAAYKNLVWSVVNLANATQGRTYTQRRDQLLLKKGNKQQYQQFVAAAQQIVAQRLALGSLAELSLRFSDDNLAITAQPSHLAHLTETDIVICPIDADDPNETAAPHLLWHRQLYRETPAQAVLLSHPPYALTLANAGQLPSPQVMPAMWDAIGGVTLLPTTEYALAALPNAARGQHVNLAPHVGALIWGNSLADVIARAEALEYVSQLTVIARHANLTDEPS